MKDTKFKHLDMVKVVKGFYRDSIGYVYNIDKGRDFFLFKKEDAYFVKTKPMSDVEGWYWESSLELR